MPDPFGFDDEPEVLPKRGRTEIVTTPSADLPARAPRPAGSVEAEVRQRPAVRPIESAARPPAEVAPQQRPVRQDSAPSRPAGGQTPAAAPVSRPAPPEQTAAGLVKRRPGTAFHPQQTDESAELFHGDAGPEDDEALAESRLKALRAFSRGIEQGRGDA